MLVVMENGNIHQFAQPLFDDETFRRFNILEIYAAECWPEIANGADELLDVLGVDLEIDRINVGEPSNSAAFPSITGFAASAPRSPSPKIAVPFVMIATMLPLIV